MSERVSKMLVMRLNCGVYEMRHQFPTLWLSDNHVGTNAWVEHRSAIVETSSRHLDLLRWSRRSVVAEAQPVKESLAA
jgi:hypothetical protein